MVEDVKQEENYKHNVSTCPDLDMAEMLATWKRVPIWRPWEEFVKFSKVRDNRYPQVPITLKSWPHTLRAPELVRHFNLCRLKYNI